MATEEHSFPFSIGISCCLFSTHVQPAKTSKFTFLLLGSEPGINCKV